MVKSWLEISLAELLLDTIVYKNYFMQRIEKQCSSWNFLLILPSARRGKAMTHLCANKHNQGWKESALTKAFNRFNCKRYFTPPGFWKKLTALFYCKSQFVMVIEMVISTGMQLFQNFSHISLNLWGGELQSVSSDICEIWSGRRELSAGVMVCSYRSGCK